MAFVRWLKDDLFSHEVSTKLLKLNIFLLVENIINFAFNFYKKNCLFSLYISIIMYIIDFNKN